MLQLETRKRRGTTSPLRASRPRETRRVFGSAPTRRPVLALHWL